MRFALLCSIAFVANTAIASVCKPRQPSDTSAVSVEATTSTASPTSTELETITTSDASSATTIATLDVTVTTTTELSTSVATSTSEEQTTESTTLSETTTTAASSLETFQIIAPEHNFQDEHLVGFKMTYRSVGFDMDLNTQPLTFSIEPETSFVREVSGLYWCVEYGSPYSPGYLQLCDKDNLGNGRWGLLACEKTDDGGLECSVKAATCGINMNNGQIVCDDLEGDYTQFYYVGAGVGNGVALTLGSKDHPPSADYYTEVELGFTPARAE